MSIRVLFFSSLADITGMQESDLDASPFRDVGSVFSKFAKDFPSLEARRSSILCALNSELARLDCPVHNGDEIAFFPPVSGG